MENYGYLFSLLSFENVSDTLDVGLCYVIFAHLVKKKITFETNQPRVKVGVSENVADFLVTVA